MQVSVAQSTIEVVQYMTVTEVEKEASWLKNFEEQLGFEPNIYICKFW